MNLCIPPTLNTFKNIRKHNLTTETAQATEVVTPTEISETVKITSITGLDRTCLCLRYASTTSKTPTNAIDFPPKTLEICSHRKYRKQFSS